MGALGDMDSVHNSVVTGNIKPEDEKAKEAPKSDEYCEVMKKYDEELESLTKKIWESEYLNV